MTMLCTRCHTAPAERAGHCEDCIRAERARIAPFVAVACDALTEAGMADLAAQARRRLQVFDRLPFELDRLGRE